MRTSWWYRLFRRTPQAEPKKETASHPRDERAFATRGKERLDQGDLDGAIADCTKAIELNADYPEAYEHRGVARERKGDLAGAKADYAKSIEIRVRAEINRQINGDNGATL